MSRILLFVLGLMLTPGAFAQDLEPFHARGFYVLHIRPGEGEIGTNQFQFSVENRADSLRFFYVSLRTEGGRNWQKGYYFQLAAHETQQISITYEVPDRSNRLLKAYFGEAESMPTGERPYPRAERYRTLLLQTEGTKQIWDLITNQFHFWTNLPPASRTTAVEGDFDEARKREDLRALVKWNRNTADAFDADVVDRFRVGEIDIQSMHIRGEPGVPITFLLMRPAGTSGPMSTVLYLSGNPPGTKESGIAKMMSLVEVGFQVVTVDRRLSARHTGPGEFLQNLADPVFDAARLVNYLLTRDDVAGERVSVVGFSRGAEEGQYLLALHDLVAAGVLIARPIDHQYLFESTAWWPTLYNPDILPEIGLDTLVDASFDQQLEALTPERSRAALEAFRDVYPYFEKLNSTYVLPLAAPKPLLVITGALDTQFPLEGVLALDDVVRTAYAEQDAEDMSALYIMPRHGHALAPRALDLIIDFLGTWTK